MTDNPLRPVEAAGMPLQPNVSGQMQMFVDVIPPQFPGGCRLVFMPADPLKLTPLGEVGLPEGCMLFYVEPNMASQIRGFQRNEMAKLKAIQANGMGPRS